MWEKAGYARYGRKLHEKEGPLAEGISTVTQAFFRKEYLTLALSILLLFGSI
jgi:hypothetical protein